VFLKYWGKVLKRAWKDTRHDFRLETNARIGVAIFIWLIVLLIGFVSSPKNFDLSNEAKNTFKWLSALGISFPIWFIGRIFVSCANIDNDLVLKINEVNPALEFTLIKIDPFDVFEHDDGLFLRVQLKFKIRNVGRVTAYHWQLTARSFISANENIYPARVADYRFADFPVRPSPSMMIYDRTILLGCSFIEAQDFGCQLRPKAHTIEAVREEIEAMLAATTINYQLATETSPGELGPTPLSLVLDVDVLVAAAREKCPGFFHI